MQNKELKAIGNAIEARCVLAEKKLELFISGEIEKFNNFCEDYIRKSDEINEKASENSSSISNLSDAISKIIYRETIHPKNTDFKDPLEKDEIVCFGGGIFIATRKTGGSPLDDPQSYQCIVAGVLSVKIDEDDENRTSTVKTTLSDGTVFSSTFLQSPRFLGTGGETEKIIKDDYYLDDDKCFFKVAKCDAPGNDDWEKIKIKGARGRVGKTGKSVQGIQGPQGISISDIIVDHGLMIVELSDGKQFDFPFYSEPDISQPISRFAGNFSGLKTYSPGEIVKSHIGLSLCISKTADNTEINNKDFWQILVPTQSMGAINPPDTFQKIYDFVQIDPPVLDIGTAWEPVALLTTGNIPAGTYELKVSYRWIFNTISDSAHVRVRSDGNAWIEMVIEPKDRDDENFESYFFTRIFTSGVHTLEMEAMKDPSGSEYDITNGTLTIERKL